MTAPVTGTMATPRILGPSLVERPADTGGGYLSVKDAVIQATRGGNTRNDAAVWAGIAPSTLSRWIVRGLTAWEQYIDIDQDDTTDHQDPLSNVPPDEHPYAELAREIARAEATARMRMVGRVVAASEEDWKAAVAWLSANERGTWAPTAKIEHSGPGGQPLASVTVMSHNEARDLRSVLVARQQRALEVGEATG